MAQVSEVVAAPPSARLIAMSDSFRLGRGRKSAIALTASVSAELFLSDDAAARLAAESSGFAVRGTIGILARSIVPARGRGRK